HLDDTHFWRRKIEKQLEELSKSSNFGSMNKVLFEKLSRTLEQINQDDSARLVRGQMSVVFWERDKADLDRRISELSARFKAMDMRPYLPCGQARVHYVMNSYPLFSSNFSYRDLYLADLKHALCLMINNSNYRSDGEGILFNDRLDNIPVLKDLGGSYSKFAQLYPGQHIILKYQQGRNLGINPFYLPPGEQPGPEALEDLSIFLMELYGGDRMGSKAHQVALKKILRHYYS